MVGESNSKAIDNGNSNAHNSASALVQWNAEVVGINALNLMIFPKKHDFRYELADGAVIHNGHARFTEKGVVQVESQAWIFLEPLREIFAQVICAHAATAEPRIAAATGTSSSTDSEYNATMASRSCEFQVSMCLRANCRASASVIWVSPLSKKGMKCSVNNCFAILSRALEHVFHIVGEDAVVRDGRGSFYAQQSPTVALGHLPTFSFEFVARSDAPTR